MEPPCVYSRPQLCGERLCTPTWLTHTQVRAASRRVLYTPLKKEKEEGHAGEAGAAAYCDRFEYRVHDGHFTSRESAAVLVEVVPELALCGTLAVATAGCWGRRTQVRRPGATSKTDVTIRFCHMPREAVFSFLVFATVATLLPSAWQCRKALPPLIHFFPPPHAFVVKVDIVRAAAAPPAVSIVVPLFNQGALLGDTLAAVAAQTFSDWEVVVVDDGSTDDSASVARALVEQYTAKGMRMRLLHKVRTWLSPDCV